MLFVADESSLFWDSAGWKRAPREICGTDGLRRRDESMAWMRTSLGALLALGAVVTASADEPKPVADADLKAWVDQQVQQRQPAGEDRRFDEVGWFTDVRSAEKAARESRRPLFLFTHDGRMNVGRC
jgi:hypothetical protein